MYHVFFVNTIRNVKLNKVRLYSTCLTSNSPITNNNKHIYAVKSVNKIANRQFSLQVAVESIIKTQSGIFKSLSESTPVYYCQELLLNIHSTSGLPWWASIMLTTVLLRTLITAPLAIYQYYILAKVENLQLEMPKIIEELKKETAIAIRKFKWDERTAKITFNRSVRKQWNSLIVRDNCHPFKASLLLWFQLPLWLFLSTSLRNLVYMLPNSDFDSQVTLKELTLGGIGFIPNLAIPDTTLILPITLGLVNLAIIEISSMSRNRSPTRFQKNLTHFFRGVSILMIPISAGVPSCLTLYWVTSSVFGLCQNLILMSPKIRRFSGIPKTKSEIDKPYLNLSNKFKDRFSFKKNVQTS